jgi:putative membrane protein
VTPSGLLIILLAVLGIYALAMSRAADQVSASRQRWRLASFSLGLLAAFLVFIPSPDLFSPDHRFTVNMGQFLLAVEVAPPLLLLGIPAAMLRPLLQWDSLGRRLTAPLVVGLVSTAVLLVWFVPVVFEAASRDLTTWLLKQALFLGAGLLRWWPVAGGLSAWKPAYPGQVVYLLVIRVPTTILGIIIAFANKLLYSSSFGLELCAPASLPDQQIGGLAMWSVGGLIMLVAFAVILYRWFGALDAVESACS